MKQYILKRGIKTILLFFIVIFLNFALIKSLPGDFVSMMMGVTPEVKAEIRENYHLNDPIYIQFFYWVKETFKAKPHGTYYTRDIIQDTVSKSALKSMAATIPGTFIGFLIALILGTIVACKHNSILDLILSFIGMIGIAMPPMLIAVFLTYIFRIKTGMIMWKSQVHLLEIQNGFIPFKGHLHLWILPFLACIILSAATMFKYVKSSMLEVLQADYVKTARSKGVSEKKVIYRHAMKNAMNPILTAFGMNFPYFFSGMFIFEEIFQYNGIGIQFISSVFSRDYSLVMSALVIMVLFTLLFNFIIDVLYGFIDPRVKLA